MLLIVLATAPQPAHAGLFSAIVKFFVSGGENSSQESSLFSISIPLLGSQSANASPAIGGSVDDDMPPLSATQDSALVANRNPSGTLPNNNPGRILVYTVQPGDTPGAIADNFGVSLNTLLWANNIRNPNLIKVGDDVLILPVPGIQVEVKKGDTISSIARKFKGDENEIRIFNGLSIDELIKPGMTLIIPDGEMATPPAPPLSQPSKTTALSTAPMGYYMRPIFGGRQTQGPHGYKKSGIDLASYCGAPVLAPVAGKVIIARSSGWNGGYGWYMAISHQRGTVLLAHLGSILAFVGQEVAQGSQVATMGSTGNSTGCHVHFETRE
ncbi:MAG: LysM peptidoglycan-binding domain-containing protein [Candidatus Sungiibacteriota bacterium]|uniref:LysM peptidoglycan-binding domain-containing protein n=1 Tax=Candidatus Sungiibacteriota bacterium TaxID=2750080 RepID=A0A7T5RIR4_9BACT|nr:MAG: LysM peptidoglycan-binding domain-containing protein [Candidatus Sungbacteria bacterium]